MIEFMSRDPAAVGLAQALAFACNSQRSDHDRPRRVCRPCPLHRLEPSGASAPSGRTFEGLRGRSRRTAPGKDRQSIAERLKPAVEKHLASSYASLAGPFLVDLAASAEQAPAKPGDPPEKRLADTRVPLHLLRYAENWDKALKKFVADEPDDPAAQLITAERAVIARLIPLLANRSPTAHATTRFHCGGRRRSRASAILRWPSSNITGRFAFSTT